MMSGFGWAKHPMLNRMDDVREDKSITLLYGARSWIDKSSWDLVKKARKANSVNVQVNDISEKLPNDYLTQEITRRFCPERGITYSPTSQTYSINSSIWLVKHSSILITVLKKSRRVS